MLDRFSHSGRRVVSRSETEARDLGHKCVGTEHLLLALRTEGDGVTAGMLDAAGLHHERLKAGIVDVLGPCPPQEPDATALRTIGIDLETIRRQVEAAFGPGALERTRAARSRSQKSGGGVGARVLWRRAPTPSGVRFTPRAKRVLALSIQEAEILGDGSVAPKHLLLGLLREGKGVAGQLLEHAGLDYEATRRVVLGGRGNTA